MYYFIIVFFTLINILLISKLAKVIGLLYGQAFRGQTLADFGTKFDLIYLVLGDTVTFVPLSLLRLKTKFLILFLFFFKNVIYICSSFIVL